MDHGHFLDGDCAGRVVGGVVGGVVIVEGAAEGFEAGYYGFPGILWGDGVGGVGFRGDGELHEDVCGESIWVLIGGLFCFGK